MAINSIKGVINPDLRYQGLYKELIGRSLISMGAFALFYFEKDLINHYQPGSIKAIAGALSIVGSAGLVGLSLVSVQSTEDKINTLKR